MKTVRIVFGYKCDGEDALEVFDELDIIKALILDGNPKAESVYIKSIRIVAQDGE